MISTVAVIHGELQWGIYRLLSDYLRFCGIAVYNYILAEKTDLDINYKFDAVIVDATNGSMSELLWQHIEERYPEKSYIWLKGNDLCWNLEEEEEKDERLSFLNHVIEKLNQSAPSLFDAGNNDKDVLRYLAKFFVEKEILKNRVVLQTFLNVEDFVLAVRRSLVEAHGKLRNCECQSQWQMNPYYWHAQRHLDRNINEACCFLGDDMLLSTKKVVAEIESRIQKGEGSNPYRAMLYFTIGRLYECDPICREKSIEAYQKGYELAKGSPFESELAYHVGRCWENQKQDWENAAEHYKCSFAHAPMEYRAVYKVAVYWWREKRNTTQACEHFKRVDEILYNWYARNVLQPREMEYLYKTWYFIRQIISEKGGTVNGITARQADRRIEEIYQNVRDPGHMNPTYIQIFGPSATISVSDGMQKLDARVAMAARVKRVCLR